MIVTKFILFLFVFFFLLSEHPSNFHRSDSQYLAIPISEVLPVCSRISALFALATYDGFGRTLVFPNRNPRRFLRFPFLVIKLASILLTWWLTTAARGYDFRLRVVKKILFLTRVEYPVNP